MGPGSDETGDERLQNPVASLVIEIVVPHPPECAEDGADALRMVGPRFAGDVGDGFHDAGAVFPVGV